MDPFEGLQELASFSKNASTSVIVCVIRYGGRLFKNVCP